MEFFLPLSFLLRLNDLFLCLSLGFFCFVRSEIKHPKDFSNQKASKSGCVFYRCPGSCLMPLPSHPPTPLCPWSDRKASGFRGQKKIETLSPFSPEEADITKVKRTPSFSAKANDTFHLQEFLQELKSLFHKKLHKPSAQFRSVFTAKTAWMSAAFPRYNQHKC